MREQRAENARKKTENLMGNGSIDYAQYDIFCDGCFRLQKSGCQGRPPTKVDIIMAIVYVWNEMRYNFYILLIRKTLIIRHLVASSKTRMPSPTHQRKYPISSRLLFRKIPLHLEI